MNTDFDLTIQHNLKEKNKPYNFVNKIIIIHKYILKTITIITYKDGLH